MFGYVYGDMSELGDKIIRLAIREDYDDVKAAVQLAKNNNVPLEDVKEAVEKYLFWFTQRDDIYFVLSRLEMAINEVEGLKS